MENQIVLYVALPIFFFLVYMLFLGRSTAESGWRIRCTKCGNSRDAREAGISLIGTLKLFSYTFDWCPGCGDIRIHKVERRTQEI